MQHTYDTVIFDLDGTLLNTLEDLKDSVNHALSAMGFPTRTLEDVRLAVGNGARMLIRRLIPESAGDTDAEQTLSHFRTHYKEHCNDCTAPYDGIIPMLDTLKNRGFRLAIVSNKPDAAVKTLCSLYFSEWILAAVGEKENVRRKPAPDSVFAALSELRAYPDKSLYVGDSDVDIATAAAAGMDCISVSWGFRDEAFLRAHGASRIIHTPSELSDILSLEQ